ncbi:MAG TPA: hypothetical protein VFZ97_06060 [Acidimicrobiales bacterium]
MTAPSLSNLDFDWWANNGPTAGYLLSFALAAADELRKAFVEVPLSVSMQILGLPRVGAFAYEPIRLISRPGTGVTSVDFVQQRLFALANVISGAPDGPSLPSDAGPPAAMPAGAYRPIEMPSPSVPVTQHFEYRPTAEVDGSGPRDGWDVVWLTPLDHKLEGRRLVASMVDCWYPPSHMQAVRLHLREGEPLRQPSPTILTAATMTFTAADRDYDDISQALLASQVTASTGGWIFERHEIWSEAGVLLAVADLVREISDRES